MWPPCENSSFSRRHLCKHSCHWSCCVSVQHTFEQFVKRSLPDMFVNYKTSMIICHSFVNKDFCEPGELIEGLLKLNNILLRTSRIRALNCRTIWTLMTSRGTPKMSNTFGWPLTHFLCWSFMQVFSCPKHRTRCNCPAHRFGCGCKHADALGRVDVRLEATVVDKLDNPRKCRCRIFIAVLCVQLPSNKWDPIAIQNKNIQLRSHIWEQACGIQTMYGPCWSQIFHKISGKVEIEAAIFL